MLGDSGIIIRSETIEVNGPKLNVDPLVADPAYREDFGKRITISLIDWRDRGLRIDAQLAPGVISEYNAIPYADRTIAENEYDQLTKVVAQGIYGVFSENEFGVARKAD